MEGPNVGFGEESSKARVGRVGPDVERDRGEKVNGREGSHRAGHFASAAGLGLGSGGTG